MRLSDKQYKAFTRTGLGIALVAAMGYDRLPPAWRMTAITAALLGAVVGFFPLLTTDVFQSSEEPECLEQTTVSHPIQEDIRKSADHVHLSNRSLAIYMEHLYKSVAQVSEKEAVYTMLCNPGLILSTKGSHSNVMALERTERMREMYELIDGLKGTSQEFSVELTGTNSIIVRCERPKESANIVQQMSKRLGHMGSLSERETVH